MGQLGFLIVSRNAFLLRSKEKRERERDFGFANNRGNDGGSLENVGKERKCDGWRIIED